MEAVTRVFFLRPPGAEYLPRRTSERTGVQALDAAVWVLYNLSKTDPARAVGNLESLDRCDMALEGTFLLVAPSVPKADGAPEENAADSDMLAERMISWIVRVTARCKLQSAVRLRACLVRASTVRGPQS